MKPKLNYDSLLDDIFMDEALHTLRVKTLKHCDDIVHRRRIQRYSLRICMGIAAMLLFAIILHTTSNHTRALPEAPYLVHTCTLSPDRVVRTSDTFRNNWIVATGNTSDIIVQESYQVARISDSDLLNEFKGAPCGIIHAPDGSTQFVFFKPEDTQRYFYNR